jgi:hypothetical protein
VEEPREMEAGQTRTLKASLITRRLAIFFRVDQMWASTMALLLTVRYRRL